MSLSITIYNQRQHKQIKLSRETVHLGGATGRPSRNEQFVDIEDPRIETEQISISWKPGSKTIELTNRGRSLALRSGIRIHHARTELQLPVCFRVGDTQVQIFDENQIQELDSTITSLGGNATLSVGKDASSANPERRLSPAPATLAAWLETLCEMQRNPAGSLQLFETAARSVFCPGGMDGAMILVPDGDRFHISASYIPCPDRGVAFRECLVNRAINSCSTIFHEARPNENEIEIPEIPDLHAAVVCPVLNAEDEVVAVVYGFRCIHRDNSRRGIRYLEAQFVQVVADSLSAGMFRLDAEAESARKQVLLEQAFAPSVAQKLLSEPETLKGQTREVTILFADLRGSTTIAERIGVQDSFDLLSDLMDKLSFAITDHDGVVIDYYGDGVSAFWNAPLEQPGHATLACQAALEMLNCIPELNELWEERIGAELNIGIGIHTGTAHVGNSGSRSRLKYGPRGSAVNIASRLESLTKQLGVPIVISGETAAQVDRVFDTTRIVKSQLKGISEPVDVYGLHLKSNGIKDNPFQRQYQIALQLFESGELMRAVGNLKNLQREFPDQKVVQFLLDLAMEQAVESLDVQADTQAPIESKPKTASTPNPKHGERAN